MASESSRCEDCDLGLLDFYLRFSGKTKEVFELCVRHKLILDSRDWQVCGKLAVLDFSGKYIVENVYLWFLLGGHVWLLG